MSNDSSATAGLPFTGERFTPECLREIRYEHYHRYAFAQQLVAGRVVLDAACGEGYGSALLAATAARVTGVDLSADSVAHARRRYAAPNLTFEAADCLHLPFEDASFDCLVSFETLEHLEDHEGLLREFRRVLRPEGFLLISSPDKAVYTDEMHNDNPWHLRELYRGELEDLLATQFPVVHLWGQRLLFQSAIWRLQPGTGEAAPAAFVQEPGREGEAGTAAEPGQAIRRAAAPLQAPVYFLALCAAEEACLPDPGLAVSLFDDAAQSVYAHYYHEIRKNMAAGGLLAERDREIEALRGRIEDLQRASRPGAAPDEPTHQEARRDPAWKRWFGRG